MEAIETKENGMIYKNHEISNVMTTKGYEVFYGHVAAEKCRLANVKTTYWAKLSDAIEAAKKCIDYDLKQRGAK